MAATRHAKVLRLPELAAFIDREARRPVPGHALPPDPDLDRQLASSSTRLPLCRRAGRASGVTCPECGSPLRQEEASAPVRFECQAGAWLVAGKPARRAGRRDERALWAAVLRLAEGSRLDQVRLHLVPASPGPGFTWYRLHRVLAEMAQGQRYPIAAGSSLASALSARQIRKLRESPGEAGMAPAPGEADAQTRRPGGAGPTVARQAGVALTAVPPEDSDTEFDELLLMLKETRGFDFTAISGPR